MAAEPPASSAEIDVYCDMVPEPGQYLSGQRRVPLATPTGPLAHGFRPPPADTPRLQRSTTWPATAASRPVVLGRCDADLAAQPRPRRANETKTRFDGVVMLLEWLERFDGDTWQQRWLASGLNAQGRRWTELVDHPKLHAGNAGRGQLLSAAGQLLVLGVVRPSYFWLYGFASRRTLDQFQARHDAEGFAELERIAAGTDQFTLADRQPAFQQLTRILMHNGATLADITVADCVEAYRAQVGYAVQKRTHWYRLLHEAGLLGADAPHTISAATRPGQRSVEELVDGYRVQCPAVRNLLIDYLHERQPALDYTSLAALASKLVLLFWRDLEIHEPGIESLCLSDEIGRRWKDRLRTVVHGKNRVGQRREDPNAILLAVRAFYTDINHWAIEDPARWAHWAAPNPIAGRDLIGQNKQKHRARARMQQRTRELAPLLPALVTAADHQRRHAAQLLAAARLAAVGEQFTVDGETLERISIAADPTRGGSGRPGLVYAIAPGGNNRRNLTLSLIHI